MRGLLTAVLAVLAACLLMGMGNLGGTPEGEIPKTDQNFRVTLVDRSGVSSELSRFSLDGNLFVKGKRGEGEVSIYFRNIREIHFGPVSGSDVPADLVQATGSRVQLKVNKDSMFFGDTGYGAYRIPASSVSRISFHR
ncbi:MAG: hypothetical protein A2X58_03310 [Nitrospirae bacterium GWC2_56_14]|nr:MAG: hypothetical protein A2X58_03310 [Nitrospirae bacterium GWC2_56_14]